jgi:hypothetical protein
MARTCVMMAAHGFHDALDPPHTFTIAPGHWIEVGRTGVTIQYARTQTHENMSPAPRPSCCRRASRS